MRWFSFSLAISFTIIGIAVAFSLTRFWPFEGLPRHIDTRWLLAASSCMNDNLSPYNVQFFEDCWNRSVGDEYLSPFVFGPPTVSIIWPLGYFDKSVAFAMFDLLNTLAIAILALLLMRASDLLMASPVDAVLRGLWVALGVSLGGIVGSAYVGQPVILVALGILLVYLASKRSPVVSFVIGSFLCLIKPHLTILPLALSWLSKGISLSQKLIALALILVPIAYLFFIDNNLVSNYRASLSIHAASAAALISEPKDLFGIPGLLSRSSGLTIAVIVVAIALLCVIGVVLGRRFYSLDRWEMLFCALLLVGVFLFPIKEYDLGVLAVLFAVASKQEACK